jgi:hypothetical protein
VRIHVAEGNHAEAIRAYQNYRTIVSDELGIVPSPLMAELVAPLCSALPLAAAVVSRR